MTKCVFVHVEDCLHVTCSTKWRIDHSEMSCINSVCDIDHTHTHTHTLSFRQQHYLTLLVYVCSHPASSVIDDDNIYYLLRMYILTVYCVLYVLYYLCTYVLLVVVDNVDNKCSKCHGEWSKENKLLKAKKKRLTLGDKGNSSCFQFVSKKDAEVAQQKYVSPNTEKSTQLATKVFANWKQAQQLADEECCPEDLLEQADPSHLAKWLSLFVVKVPVAISIRYPQFLRIDMIQ